jgi:hypothetical protein
MEQILKAVTQVLRATVEALHGFPVATTELVTDFFPAAGRK